MFSEILYVSPDSGEKSAKITRLAHTRKALRRLKDPLLPSNNCERAWMMRSLPGRDARNLQPAITPSGFLRTPDKPVSG